MPRVVRQGVRDPCVLSLGQTTQQTDPALPSESVGSLLLLGGYKEEPGSRIEARKCEKGGSKVVFARAAIVPVAKRRYFRARIQFPSSPIYN